MFARNALPKFPRLFLIGLALLALLMTSSASIWGQSKKEAKKAPSKAVGASASDQETGLSLSSDRKSITIKPGFFAEQISEHQAIIKRRRVDGSTPRITVLAECYCFKSSGDLGSTECKFVRISPSQLECKSPENNCTGSCVAHMSIKK